MIFKYFIFSTLVTIALSYPLEDSEANTDDSSPIVITFIGKRKNNEQLSETCEDGKLALLEQVLNKLRSCEDSGIDRENVGNKHQNCKAICLLGALGHLGREGLPSYELHESWIKKQFPSSVQAIALSHFSDCYRIHESTFDLKDENCVGLNNFNKCIWSLKAIWSVCIN